MKKKSNCNILSNQISFKTFTIPQLKSVVEKVKQLESETENEMNKFKDQRDDLWKQVGNMLHDTVALGDTEVL